MANIATITRDEKATDIHVGDTVRVHYKLIEHEKSAGKTKKEVKEEVRERLQVFEGIVIAIKNAGDNQMFTVRRIGVGAIGVERIFPVNSPWIRKIEVKKLGDVRRAKLYYLRAKVGKDASRVDELHTATTETPTPTA
jgi:large subunit ribosomal protein L19